MMARVLGLGLVLASIAVISVAAPAAPSSSSAPLGRIDFPVTGPPLARRHFLRGMLALHSFWYEEAADEFRAATVTAPDFAMGYWGEALTYYHPVWTQEDLAASRAVMARLPAAAHVTTREQAFIDAAHVLFGDGDRASRWRRYAESLAEIHRSRPGDDEAATLYAVALMGAALGERQLDSKPTTFQPFAEAGAIALSVLARSPSHPGAAHYVIHAFDDPDHAILALPAARRYASIAPEAYHARHMPSHIFVQLGMWPEAVLSNEAAWAASKSWVRRKHLDTSYLDFHSLSWLLSIRFEMGQRQRAEEVLGRARDALARSRDPGRLPLIYSNMVAEYLLQTDQWSHMDEWLAPLVALAEGTPVATSVAAVPAVPTPTSASLQSNTCHPAAERAAHAALEARALLAFLRGEAAAARRDLAVVTSQVQTISRLAQPMDELIRAAWKVRELELSAAAAELRGKPDDAVVSLRHAIALDERVPPSGPAGDATPRERLGELLLRQGKPTAAVSEFIKAMEIHPGRTHALLGAARAAIVAGDSRANVWWSRLAGLWAEAETDTPGLAEARRASLAAPVPVPWRLP